MINNQLVRLFLRDKLINDGSIDTNLIAFENRPFDSTLAPLWYREKLQTIDEGINSNQSNVKTGMYTIDVVTRKGYGTADLDNVPSAIAALFEPSQNKEVSIDSTTKIDLDSATTGVAGDDVDPSRYAVPVRMEFRVYQTEAT